MICDMSAIAVVQTLGSSFGICFNRGVLAAADGTVSRIGVVDPKCVTERNQIEEHSESDEYQRVSVGQTKRSCEQSFAKNAKLNRARVSNEKIPEVANSEIQRDDPDCVERYCSYCNSLYPMIAMSDIRKEQPPKNDSTADVKERENNRLDNTADKTCLASSGKERPIDERLDHKEKDNDQPLDLYMGPLSG
jgi:hypothetical protein